jgi:hypothetical protein
MAMFSMLQKPPLRKHEREDSNQSDIREALIKVGQYARIQERKARRA